jgi:hypothetical protein
MAGPNSRIIKITKSIENGIEEAQRRVLSVVASYRISKLRRERSEMILLGGAGAKGSELRPRLNHHL